MRFLRHAALLLPSAFLLVVLVFLLTHGRKDPGFGTYPFFQEWAGERAGASAPETRFLEQALVFFLPAFAVALLFILAVAVAERVLFGRKRAGPGSALGRAFVSVFSVLFLAASVVVMWLGESLALRQAPGTLIAPLLAAAAPFIAAVVAVLPAAVLAAPWMWLRKASGA